MPISRITDSDDSGAGTDGTIHNNAWLQTIYDSIEAAFTWTAVAFNAANFTASGAMTWVVASGDQTTFAYKKIGETMTVWFVIETSTIGGTPSTNLNIAIPGGFTPSRKVTTAIYVVNGGAAAAGRATVEVSGTSITCFLATAANWTGGANDASVQGVITFETTT